MRRDKLLIQALPDWRSRSDWRSCLSPPQSERQFIILEAEVADGQRRAIVKEHEGENEQAFHIFNPEEQEIYLFAIDGCFFTDEDHERCDCLVYDNQCLCFVELKLDVTSPRQATSRLKKARSQLGETILSLKEALAPKTTNFWGFETEAYVVMKKRLYPRRSARLTRLQAVFLEKYGVRLYEENTKTF
jgi:hypothetical protein